MHSHSSLPPFVSPSRREPLRLLTKLHRSRGRGRLLLPFAGSQHRCDPNFQVWETRSECALFTIQVADRCCSLPYVQEPTRLTPEVLAAAAARADEEDALDAPPRMADARAPENPEELPPLPRVTSPRLGSNSPRAVPARKSNCKWEALDGGRGRSLDGD